MHAPPHPNFRWLLAPLALAFTFVAHDCLAIGTDVLEQYRQQTFRAEDGLPNNAIETLLQTRDGYLWIGTKFGLARFDGVSFRAFDRASSPALIEDNCEFLVEDAANQLWIASTTHLTRFHEGRFTPYRITTGLREERIRGICARREGGLWLACANGLKLFYDGKITQFTTADGLADNFILAVHEDPDGCLWVATQAALQTCSPGHPGFADFKDESGNPIPGVTRIARAPDGSLWLGTWEQGLLQIRDGKWNQFTTTHGLEQARVATLRVDHAGAVWFTTGSGRVQCLRNGRIEPFDRDRVLVRETAECLYEDREQNLWIGTRYEGLKRLHRWRVSAFSVRHGLAHHNIWSISESRNGSMWFGSNAGITHGQNGEFSAHPLPDGDPRNQANCVLEDSEGITWVGTKSTGLLSWTPSGGWTRRPLSDNLRDDQVFSFFLDPGKHLWVGTRGGLYRRSGDSFDRVHWPGVGSPTLVRAMHQDRAGRLWLATYGTGLMCVENEMVTQYRVAHGLADDAPWVLHEDRNGALWIGTQQGLNRFKDGKFATLTTAHGLFDNVINSILQDDTHDFWIGCNRGIFAVSEAELNSVADGISERVSYTYCGAADGMLSSETNGEYQPSACRARDGSLWFPTTDGVVKIIPAALARNKTPPPIAIEDVFLDDVPLDRVAASRLEPGRGRVLEVRYTAPTFTTPDQIQFAYRLLGHSSDWTSAGHRRVAYYTNLRPGKYEFQVKARSSQGAWSEPARTFSMTLPPHFYQTYPFYGASLLLLGWLAWTLHRRRLEVFQRIQHLEQQSAVESERARISHEMHDDLGASLTQITLLSEIAHRQLPVSSEAAPYLQKIIKTTRELFRAMDEIVWAANPVHDILPSLIDYICKHAQQHLGLAGVRCRLEIPESLPDAPLTSEQRHNLFLAAKEALHNIAKHSGAAEAWIRVAVDSGLQLVIEDNGRGFDRTTIEPGRNGLSNMQRRLEAIGGTFELTAQPGCGTRIRLRLELPNSEDRGQRTEGGSQ